MLKRLAMRRLAIQVVTTKNFAVDLGFVTVAKFKSSFKTQLNRLVKPEPLLKAEQPHFKRLWTIERTIVAQGVYFSYCVLKAYDTCL